MAENTTGDNILKVWGPLAVTILILGLFGWAFYSNPYDEGLLEQIKAVFMLAVGFWIGSSGGSKRKEGEPGSVTIHPPAEVTARKLRKTRRARSVGQGELLDGP